MAESATSRSDDRRAGTDVVLVTGASRGLGKAVALACARRSSRVALLARSADQLEAVAAEVRATGGEAKLWPVDLRDPAGVSRTVKTVYDHWGRVDVLVNAAGIKPVGPVEEMQRTEVMEALEVNYLGPLAMCQAVIPAMREEGRGHIINVSSVLGKRATPMRGVYSASKAALNALTESLRVELAGEGIEVTLVCPGRMADARDAARGWLKMTETRAAERIVRCMDRPKRELVLTTAGRVLVGLNTWSPGLVDRIVGGWRRRERALASRHAG